VSLPLIADAGALVGNWLRDHDDIAALGTRVASSTPKSMELPWIRVTQLDATDDARGKVEHLITYPLQLDCYAGKAAMDDYAGQAEASLVARTARAVLIAMRGTTADGYAISSVHVTGPLRDLDTAIEPARERAILTVTIKLHALPA
jgi:hypothetical protein